LAFLTGAVLLLAGISRGQAGDWQQPIVRIALRPFVEVGGPLVTLDDVADLRGGDTLLRRQIGELDVAECGTLSNDLTVSSRQVVMRLLLAGLPASAFDVAGSDEVRITRRDVSLRAEIVEQSIRAALAETFHLDLQDVEVRLLQPLMPAPDPAIAASDEVVVEPVLPAKLPLGRTRIKLVLRDQGQPRQEVNATIEVATFRTVAAAAKLLLRGETVTEEKVIDRRVRLVSPASFASVADVTGCTVTRALEAGENIRVSDVTRQTAQEESLPLLVRVRDKVRVVVRRGRLTVVLSAADALESGRMGDTIRVRNPQTKKVITARVVAAGELEVPL
jgi:flagella basal body P-ring formation protein FlgA